MEEGVLIEDGKASIALATSGASWVLCDSMATIGCTPRYWALSAVILSWKCSLAAGEAFFLSDVSRTATEVSSLYVC